MLSFLENIFDNSVNVLPCVSGIINIANMPANIATPLWIQNTQWSPITLTNVGKHLTYTNIITNLKRNDKNMQKIGMQKILWKKELIRILDFLT